MNEKKVKALRRYYRSRRIPISAEPYTLDGKTVHASKGRKMIKELLDMANKHTCLIDKRLVEKCNVNGDCNECRSDYITAAILAAVEGVEVKRAEGQQTFHEGANSMKAAILAKLKGVGE